jgi:geranylgeranyl reductase family protein
MDTLHTCDVLIVGGGPAGSSCAWKLRGAGLDILILDKAPFPRDKICAGWITPAILEELELDPHDYRAGRVFQPITGFRTSCIGGPQVETRYDAPVSYGIRRCEFDHYLLQRSGARLALGQPFQGLRRDGDTWIVNESIRASLVIGAGGHFCPVARFATEKRSDDAVVLAQEIEFEMSPEQLASCRVEGETPELFFCDDLQGYGWCFRKGNYLNIGLGRENEQHLSAHVERFCDYLKQAGRIPSDVPSKFHGHAYRLHQHAPRRQTEDRLLLIGDAAGLAYPQSGEGIRPAIESGLMAADAILQYRDDLRRLTRADLQARLDARFGPAEPQARFPNLLPARFRGVLASQLLKTRWFTRHVLIDRWFLHTHQPPLAAAT